MYYICIYIYIYIYIYVYIYLFIFMHACVLVIDSHHGVHFKRDAYCLEEQEPQVAGANRGAPGDHQWNQSDCDAILYGSKGK